jgi:hypothetical protein
MIQQLGWVTQLRLLVIDTATDPPPRPRRAIVTEAPLRQPPVTVTVLPPRPRPQRVTAMDPLPRLPRTRVTVMVALLRHQPTLVIVMDRPRLPPTQAIAMDPPRLPPTQVIATDPLRPRPTQVTVMVDPALLRTVLRISLPRVPRLIWLLCKCVRMI